MSTLANATDVLKLIARLRRDISVMDVANELQLPKSSASRTLSMMASQGLLERDGASRAYRPGSVIMEASYHFRASRNAVSLLEEALAALVAQTGYTGYLNVLDMQDTVVIQLRAATGGGPLQVYSPPGTRAPAYASSMGRAILARFDDADVVARIGGRLVLRKGNVPRTRKDLLARLTDIRAAGWALSRGEYVDNVAGISAAVADPANGQIYGIGIALPVADLDDALVARFGRMVRDTALRVGKQVGDPFWLGFDAP